jgi:hypothetical protein
VSRWSLTAVSRPARIGALVGVAAVSPLGPFLAYAGLAVANVSADWTGSVVGPTVGSVVGLVAYILWILLVFGVPALCGGLLGSLISRIKARSSHA